MTLEKIDFMLSPCGDTAIQDGKLVRITGADLIRQLWLIRVRTFKGEWILDALRGVPYIQEVFEKNVSKTRLEEIFRDVTSGTPGVVAVESILIGDIDAATRVIDLTVEAIIEGGESITFHYDGTLGIGACSLPGAEDFPKTIEGMTVWFDGQDLAFIEYAPPNLSLENKAATGSASSTNVVLEGVSGIGLKRGLLFVAASSTYMDFVDTPAIRHGDGDLTIVAVMKHEKIGSLSGKQYYGIIALDGYDVTAAENEFYNFEYVVDYDNPDESAIRLVQGRVGEDPNAITINGQTVPAAAVYRGGDGPGPGLPAHIGDDLVEEGSGADIDYGVQAYGNGEVDLAVKGNLGKVLASSSAFIFVGVDDFIIRVLFYGAQPAADSNLFSVGVFTSDRLRVMIDVNGRINLDIDDGTTFKRVQSALNSIEEGTLYLLHVIGRRVGFCALYLNKVVSGTPLDISAANLPIAAGRAAMLGYPGGSSPTRASVIYVSVHHAPSWLDSHLQPVWVEDDFNFWSNLYPQLALGTPNPTTVTAEETHIEQIVSGVTYLHHISDRIAPVGRPIVDFNAYRFMPSVQNILANSNNLAPVYGFTNGFFNIATGVNSPDPNLDYQGMVADTSINSQHYFSFNTVPSTAGNHCTSGICKQGSLPVIRLRCVSIAATCDFDLNTCQVVGTPTGFIIDCGIFDLGNGHCLWWLIIPHLVGATVFRLYSSESAGDLNFTGDGSTIQTYAGFLQSELGDIPNSRVFTEGAVRTRAADKVTYKLDDGNITQGQGTVEFELLMPFDTAVNNSFFVMWDGTINNKIDLLVRASTGKLTVEVWAGGILQSANTGLAVVDQGTRHEIRLSYEDGDLKLWVDDILDITATPATIPVGLTEVSITSNIVLWFRNLRFYGDPEVSNLLFEGLTGNNGIDNLSENFEALAPINVTDESSHIVIGELTSHSADQVSFKGYSESSEAEAPKTVTKRLMNGDGVIGASLDNVAHANRVNFADGNINELMVYDRKLTDEERESLIAFLKGKWGIS